MCQRVPIWASCNCRRYQSLASLIRQTGDVPLRSIGDGSKFHLLAILAHLPARSFGWRRLSPSASHRSSSLYQYTRDDQRRVYRRSSGMCGQRSPSCQKHVVPERRHECLAITTLHHPADRVNAPGRKPHERRSASASRATIGNAAET